MATGVSSYSKTAATNASASSNINYAEGQSPGSLNNSARQVMADIASWRDDIGGAVATTGSANTYAATTNGSVGALAAGARLCVRINATNTGASTFNPDSLGAKAIRKIVGGADVDVDAGDLQAGQAYDLAYVTSLNSSAGGWLLVGLVNAKGYRLGSVQVFTAAGTPTWTKPSGCRAVRVRVKGSGGGGGGATGAASNASMGAGGGEGEYAERFIASGLGTSETVTVGAGGTGGAAAASPNAGGNGNTTSFGSFVSAGGGSGGATISASTSGNGCLGGAGGTGGSNGDIHIRGTVGGNGARYSGTAAISGHGGGEGGGKGVQNADSNGGTGLRGGGGAGGCSLSTAQRAGGDGGDGWCIVEEFY